MKLKKSLFAAVVIVALVPGCAFKFNSILGTPQIEALVKGAPMTEVEKVLDNATVFDADDFEFEGKPYAVRHYRRQVGTRMVPMKSCNKVACTTTMLGDPLTGLYFVVIDVQAQRLVASGTAEELSKFQDPAVRVVWPRLRHLH
jgi:hypothetical protein